MKEIIYISGGQRSGKSSFAEKLAEEYTDCPIYLATARSWDEDFEKRIQRHKKDRGEKWQTIEEDKKIEKFNLEGQTVVLDCITLWLTNIFHDHEYHLDESLKEAKEIWDKFSSQRFRLIVVSNEIGMGLHASDESTRHFVDLQGWMNQYIAKSANKAYVLISGIPLRLK